MAAGFDDAALAILISGIASSAGSIYNTNRQLQQAGDLNDSSINLANTAHQREVLDLKMAGVNPVLTAGGSGAAVPTLKAADTENPLSGLSEGLSSASKLLSEEYKQGVESMRLGNHQTEIINSALEQEKEASKIESENNLELANLERDAINKFIGNSSRWDGEKYEIIHNRKKYAKAVDLAEQALISDYKQRANANWRANLSSFMPFTSAIQGLPSSMHSAGKAYRMWRNILK